MDKGRRWKFFERRQDGIDYKLKNRRLMDSGTKECGPFEECYRIVQDYVFDGDPVSFREHLKSVSDKVRDWPKWKKDCISKYDSPVFHSID